MLSRVAIVTGGAAGIGRATAETFLSKNIRVCVSDVNAVDGKKTETEFKEKYGTENVFFKPCDVTSMKDLRGMFDSTLSHYGRVDIVVNNAGMMNENKQMATLDLNLRSVIQSCELCMEFMGKPHHPGGVIVNVASIAGIMPMPNIPVYTATKHAIVGYSRALGMLLPEMHNIRVNCVCPGYTDTNILSQLSDRLVFPTKERVEIITKSVRKMPVINPRVVGDCVWELVQNESLTAQVYVASSEHPRSALHMPDTESGVYKTYCGDKPKL